MKKTHPINVLHLYPKDMNIYGDNGNVLVIKKRLERRGFIVNIIEYNPGDNFPEQVDLIIGGGGQDSGQKIIQKDLIEIGPTLIKLADSGVPMLVVCGLYQLFGRFFKTYDGEKIEGIGLLDIETYGKNVRLTGNIVAHSKVFGDIVGYENHSGQTFLLNGTEPLATVVSGAGNNAKDNHEGVIYKNIIGTYMHGSLLPKNPAIADWLIQKALQNILSIDFELEPLNDDLAEKARKVAIKRSR